MNKHTPTPWNIVKSGTLGAQSIYIDGRNQSICNFGSDPREIEEANAEFIVRACNAHDELVSALTELLSYQSIRELREYGNFPVFAQCDAALAKARGEA